MYELNYPVEKLSNWNDYFTSPDEIRFNEFLHFYESVLERKASKFIQKYNLEDYRLDDLKQIFALVLWEELKEYKSDIPLLQIVKPKVLQAWHEYVRLDCGNVMLDNPTQYMKLRKIAWLYYKSNGNQKSIDEAAEEIAKELGMKPELAKNYIYTISTFKQKYNADFYGSDDEEDYYSSAVDSVDNRFDTEKLFFREYQREDLINALSQLKPKDRQLIEYVFGICPDCLGGKEKKTLREVSLLLGMTEDGASARLKSILQKLKKELQQ